MTREEREDAIKFFNEVAKREVGTYSKLAIEALEQQPCEDKNCISRQAVINTLDKMDKALDIDRTVESYKKLLTECYKDLPPVTTKEKTGKWIQQPRCEGDEQPDLVCPNCGFKISWWDMGNFCAKCGKRLEGGAE